MYDNQIQKAKLFKALGDVKRIAIIELLQKSEMCACSISKALDIPQSALSYHMRLLCESGIVRNRHDGKWIHYKIDETHSDAAISMLTNLTTFLNLEIEQDCD